MQGEDREKLQEICNKHNIQLKARKDLIIFSCSDVPHIDVQRELIAAVPKSHQFRIIVTPSPQTEEAIRYLLQSISFYGLMDITDQKLTIKNDQLNVPKEHPFWEAMDMVLQKDNFFLAWDITLGTVNVSHNKSICKKLQKRGDRDHCPTADEIKDLQITLEQPDKDVNDFIKELFPNETD